MNETMKPMASTTHSCDVISATPIGFSSLPESDLYKVYSVAIPIVGIERKNENSSAAARDIPASWPELIVDIDRDVPGNTADRIWHAPIQIAWPPWISSMFQVWIGEPAAP